MYLFSPERF